MIMGGEPLLSKFRMRNICFDLKQILDAVRVTKRKKPSLGALPSSRCPEGEGHTFKAANTGASAGGDWMEI